MLTGMVDNANHAGVDVSVWRALNFAATCVATVAAIALTVAWNRDRIAERAYLVYAGLSVGAVVATLLVEIYLVHATGEQVTLWGKRAERRGFPVIAPDDEETKK